MIILGKASGRTPKAAGARNFMEALMMNGTAANKVFVPGAKDSYFAAADSTSFAEANVRYFYIRRTSL